MKRNRRLLAGTRADSGAARRRRVGRELARLRQQTDEMLDREAIRRLPIAYAHFARTKNVAGLVGLYAKDAVFDVPRADPWPCIRGHCFEMLESGRAEGAVYIELRVDGEGLGASHVGCFRDDYIKEEGVWKFRSRQLCAIPVPMTDAGRG